MTATTTTEKTFELPAIMDLQAAASLRDALLPLQGSSLTINGEGVRRIGGQCLQVLLAARKSWAADGFELRLENLSTAFDEALQAFGLTPDSLMHQKDAAA
jgi:chemotaxis protein CheX